MKTIIHKAETRGHANHGWLDTHHTFSFADYHNPERMSFGVLRVLNDDIVDAGMGFDSHHHENMEIVSIPLKGELVHKDSMGNTTTIKEGEIQVMTAGTGVFHSEYNKSLDKSVNFLQIWIYPCEKDLIPRYCQTSIQKLEKNNCFFQILSPNKNEPGVWINQDAWIHLGYFDNNKSAVYEIKKQGNGVYLFVLEGDVEVEGNVLGCRDGFGIWDIESFTIAAKSQAKVIVIEVPLKNK